MESWIKLILVSAVAWFICHGFRVWDRVRLRHVPQVPMRWHNFLVGHLSDLWHTPPYVWNFVWMRQLGGIYLMFLGKSPVVVLSDPELVRQVAVSKFKAFSDRPGFINLPRSKDKRVQAIQSGLLVAKGAYWASLRAALQPLFHTAALHSYAPSVTQSVAALADKLRPASSSGEAVELHALLGSLTMGVIGKTAFGIEFSTEHAKVDQAAGIPNVGAAVAVIFKSNRLISGGGMGGTLLRIVPTWMHPLLFHIFFVALGRTARTLEYARSTLMATGDLLMRNALERARQEGRKVAMRQTDWQWWDSSFIDLNPYKNTMPAQNSVIDMLMRATNKETGEGLSDMQIAASCNTLLAAGYETSSNSLAFTIHLLSSNPEAEAKLLAEVDAFGRDKVPSCEDLASFPYTDAVIHESLRLFPPAYVTMREANEDAMVGRHLIPKGMQVHFNIYGLHHSPDHWPQPEAFRPERFLDEAECAARHPNAYMPFGRGPRMCIGWRFAMNEMALALIRLYQQYTFRHDPAHNQLPLQLRAGITLAPAAGLWVTVHPRQ